MWARELLFLNLAAALYLTGLIWFVQVVHYPLFAEISAGDFPRWIRLHQRWTSWVVAPPMVVEFAASAGLLLAMPKSPLVWIAGLLTVILWSSTFFVQVPLHQQLLLGFDRQAAKRLVSTNWIRTSCWTLRSALLLSMAIG